MIFFHEKKHEKHLRPSVKVSNFRSVFGLFFFGGWVFGGQKFLNQGIGKDVTRIPTYIPLWEIPDFFCPYKPYIVDIVGICGL